MLNASWKISCLAVNGQSFLVIDGYLLNYYFSSGSGNGKIIGKIKSSVKTKKKKIYGAAFILADILTAFIFSGAAKI